MSKKHALAAGGIILSLAVAQAGAGWASDLASLPATAADVGLATVDFEAVAAAAPEIVTPRLFAPDVAEALGLPADKAAQADAGATETDAALGSIAGRGTETTNVAVALTEQNLSAVNTGNTVMGNSVGSGAISLQDNALSGFSGIGNIMMNTGHNNNLQSNMSVTIVITP